MVGESIMSRVPTEQMKKAMIELMETNKNYIEFGKKKEHAISYSYMPETDSHCFIYKHYDVVCLYVKITVGIETYIELSSRAWSNTDRDNMNGMLYMLDINRVKVYKCYDRLYLSVDGEKSNLNNIIIE